MNPAGDSTRPSTEEGRWRTWTLAALAIVATVLLAAVLRPLAGALFASGVLVAALAGPHRRLSRRLGDRPSLAALLVTILLVVGIAVPLTVLALLAIGEIEAVVERLAFIVQREGFAGLEQRMPAILAPVVDAARATWPDLEGIVESAAGGAATAEAGGRPAGEATGRVLAGGAVVAGYLIEQLTFLTIDAVVALVALFMALAHGGTIVRWTVLHLPLASFQTRRLLVELRRASNGVFASTFVVAAVQAAVAAIGYAIVGMPQIVLASAATFVAGLFGIAAPMTGALALATGFASGWGGAIVLGVWALLPVNLVENFLRPVLARRFVHVPSSVLFLALIGGVVVFGPLGLLAGPLIVAFFRASMRMLTGHLEARARRPRRELPPFDAACVAPGMST